MPSYILSFDQGTTSSRSIIFNKAGSIVSVAQKEFTQIFPQPGWVEHDANEIWSTQIGTAAEAITKAGLNAKDIHAIGRMEGSWYAKTNDAFELPRPEIA